VGRDAVSRGERPRAFELEGVALAVVEREREDLAGLLSGDEQAVAESSPPESRTMARVIFAPGFIRFLT
jgi:hypothetical protein